MTTMAHLECATESKYGAALTTCFTSSEACAPEVEKNQDEDFLLQIVPSIESEVHRRWHYHLPLVECPEWKGSNILV
jgi:hypothetical protein